VGPLSADFGADLGQHLFGIGMPAGRLLGVDEVAVDGDLEDAAPGGDESELRDRVLELFEDGGRQTDGLVEIASDRAVLECDPH
jgi:hypothetical protein